MSKVMSVLMAVKNEEMYVLKAVSSVLAETRMQLEVVVVDDGSTDGTLSVLRSIQDPRLRIINGPGGGKVSAFNRAYASASGNYYCLFAGDDVMVDGALYHRFRRMEKDGSDNAVMFSRLKTMSLSKRFDGVVIPKNSSKGNRSGGALTFSKSFGDRCFPIPPFLANEDIWIGLHAEYFCKSVIEDDCIVILYRIHERNSLQQNTPFDVKTKQIHDRLIVYSEFLRKYRDSLSSSAIRRLESLSAAESLRFCGSSFALIFVGNISLREKLRSIGYSRRSLYALRQWAFRYFSA